jgi:hypothetical protein
MDFHKNQKATYKKQLFDFLKWTWLSRIPFVAHAKMSGGGC